MKLKSKEKHLYKLPIKKQSSFGKINGENYSTTSQLKMFATLIKEGSLVEASIDTADNNRMPAKAGYSQNAGAGWSCNCVWCK